MPHGSENYRLKLAIQRYFSELGQASYNKRQAKLGLDHLARQKSDREKLQHVLANESRVTLFLFRVFTGKNLARLLAETDRTDWGFLQSELNQVVATNLMRHERAGMLLGYHQMLLAERSRELRRIPNRHDNRRLGEPRLWGEQPRADLLLTLDRVAGALMPVAQMEIGQQMQILSWVDPRASRPPLSFRDVSQVVEQERGLSLKTRKIITVSLPAYGVWLDRAGANDQDLRQAHDYFAHGLNLLAKHHNPPVRLPAHDDLGLPDVWDLFGAKGAEVYMKYLLTDCTGFGLETIVEELQGSRRMLDGMTKLKLPGPAKPRR